MTLPLDEVHLLYDAVYYVLRADMASCGLAHTERQLASQSGRIKTACYAQRV